MTDAIAKTAFYCAGARMLDARAASPLVDDRLAERLMGEQGMQIFEAFRGLRHPNGSVVARHKIIDDALRERFKGRPERLAVVLGAGLDTRAFRFRTGRWVEIDMPGTLDYKERLLPAASCPVPLTRIGLDLSRGSLEDTLSPYATSKKVSVIVEGVFMYLDESVAANMAKALSKLFPNHTLICDLLSRRFARRYAGPLRNALSQLGAELTWTPDDPVKAFRRIGYERVGGSSIVLRAAEWKSIPVATWAVRWLLPTLRDGYAVHLFKPASAS